MPKNPPWEISVVVRDETLAGRYFTACEFTIPDHKIGEKGLKELLKALVIKASPQPIDCIFEYYINNRRGSPLRSGRLDTIYEYDDRRGGFHYICGNYNCYAVAEQEINPEIAEATRQHVATNRKYSGGQNSPRKR